MEWNFQREERKFAPLPEGRYRIRIKSAEKAVSKSGNDMLALQFAVSGSNSTLFHYIVFMPDRPEITNRMLTQFFDSFKDIEAGNLNMATWIGKVGACTVKHEEYNDDIKAKIGYFIPADKQGDLPAWKEPDGGSGAVTTDANGFLQVPDGMDLPF